MLCPVCSLFAAVPLASHVISVWLTPPAEGTPSQSACSGNASFGYVPSESVGQAGLVEEEDASGECMRQFLLGQHAVAADALQRAGDGGTFASKGQGPTRIDYSLLGRNFAGYLRGTTLDHGLEVLRDHDGHFRVIGALEWTVSALKPNGSHPPP
eukprot:602676-Pyramimonas_sp.AAC.1